MIDHTTNDTAYRLSTVTAEDELSDIVGCELEVEETFTPAEWAAVRAVAESVMVVRRHVIKTLVGAGPDRIGPDTFDAADTPLVGVDMAEAIVQYEGSHAIEMAAMTPSAGRQYVCGPEETSAAYQVYLEWLGDTSHADTDLVYGFAAVEASITPTEVEAAWGRFVSVLAAASQMETGMAIAQTTATN